MFIHRLAKKELKFLNIQVCGYDRIRFSMDKHEKGTPGKPNIMQEILAYLSEHPDAQDTLEGIAEWWLLKHTVRHKTREVKESLSELVAQGLILEHKGKDAHLYYRINRSKYEEIKVKTKQRKT